MRIALVLVALSLVWFSNTQIDVHDDAVCALIDEGTAHGSLSAYEKPECLHLIHDNEANLLWLVGFCGILSVSSHVARSRVPGILWVFGLVGVMVFSIVNCAFEMIADGAEGQFGAVTEFASSYRPIVFADLLVLIVCASLLYLGPPRGWDGREDFFELELREPFQR